jgi:hypothetical protein
MAGRYVGWHVAPRLILRIEPHDTARHVLDRQGRWPPALSAEPLVMVYLRRAMDIDTFAVYWRRRSFVVAGPGWRFLYLCKTND